MDQEKIMNCVDNVPSLSPTATKIIQVANNINSSANELVQVIKMDPVLTGKVLKLINSVYYGMPQKVVSLGRAVILLGINTIKNLALSTAVLGAFKHKGNLGAFNMNLFWEHCLGCGVGSKLLAKSRGVSKMQLEEYFIGGLLHDIGKITLVQFDHAPYDKVLEIMAEEPERDEAEIEEEILGTTHTKIGGLIANKWKLPEALKEGITGHHNPTTEGTEFSIKVAVHLANIDCNRKEFSIVPSRSVEFTESILQAMDMTDVDVELALAPLADEIELAKIFLKLT